MSEEESKEREELFEEFKQRIDALRLPGQKLYSQS
jgi:two-component sensor histidine kinase